MGKVAELKAEIDQLRRDRASLLSNIYAAQQDIASIDDQVANHHTQMETKNKFAGRASAQRRISTHAAHYPSVTVYEGAE
jgi:septal ring factor EnvC (AmiA/AmiB activator)